MAGAAGGQRRQPLDAAGSAGGAGRSGPGVPRAGRAVAGEAGPARGPRAGVHGGQRRADPHRRRGAGPAAGAAAARGAARHAVRLLPRAGDAPALRTGRALVVAALPGPVVVQRVRGPGGARTTAAISTDDGRPTTAELLDPPAGREGADHGTVRLGPAARRVQPWTAVLRRARRRDAGAQPRRWRPGLGPVRAGQRRRRVGLRRALRRRPGGRPAGRGRPAGPQRSRHRRHGGPDARHRPGHLPPGLQRGGQLHAVVRPPPALRDPDRAGLRLRLPPRVVVLRGVQPGVRGGPVGRGRRRAPRCWCRTTT